MRLALLFIVAGILIACNNDAVETSGGSDTATAKKDSVTEGKMKQYWLIFLRKGPKRDQDSGSAAKIQEAHLANIGRLASQGIIIMAGPMGRDEDLRGIFIMDAKDSLTAASYINTDSAVTTGRLRFEIHPWWTMTGEYKFK